MKIAPLPDSFAAPDSPALRLSALEQAQALRRGELTSEELVLLYLARIAHHDKRLGSFVAVQGERALAEAQAKDRLLCAARKSGQRLPPFFGVPTAVKDLHLLRGAPARMGSRSFSWLYSPFDDLTVRALRKAGFVLLGKTSTSELALLPVVETDLHPPTRNPWDLERTAGGSSGGAAAAVAAGLIPVAPGSDGAGSVRIPASLCGLFGLKPSRDAIPNPHSRFDHARMTAIGTLARCAEDGVALADVLCGRDPESPSSWLQVARRPPRRLRIGLMVHPALDCPVEPVLVEAARAAARALVEAGHELVGEAPRTAVRLEEFLPIYQRLFARMPVPFEGRLQPVTRWFRSEGRRVSEAMAHTALEGLRRRIEEVDLGVDLIISPPTAMLPPAVGAFAHLPPAEMFRALAPLGAFTAPWNISGQPAVTIPWTRSSEGLPVPVGVQLIGRLGEDATVCAAARQLEAICC